MNLAELLRIHPFFKGLDEAHFVQLEGLSRRLQFARNEYILRQNQAIADCHLICSGRVMLETCDTRGACLPVQTLEAGAVVGWSWLQPPYHSFFDARALEDVTTLALDAARLRLLMEADHDFGYEFLKRAVRPMMSRLQACRLQLADVYAHPAETRR